MSENQSTAAETGDRARGYAYPAELARFVRAKWHEVPALTGGESLSPDEATLEDFFSVCYLASQLREEERPVTFRAILAPRGLLRVDGMPPENLLRLEFARSFSADASELRRLSVAAGARRMLIGLQPGANGQRALHRGSVYRLEVPLRRRSGATLDEGTAHC